MPASLLAFFRGNPAGGAAGPDPPWAASVSGRDHLERVVAVAADILHTADAVPEQTAALAEDVGLQNC